MIYIGADHRGFNLKEKLKTWLTEFGFEFAELGNIELDPEDDYTQFAHAVAQAVAKSQPSMGIIACGSGVGVDIVANKVDGIRAGLGISPEQIASARADDDINILVLAADHIKESDAKQMVKVFLETDFDKLPRHQRRLEDITRFEQSN